MAQPGGRIDTPPACDLSAIPADARASHLALARALFAAEHGVIRHADGLEVSLPSDRLTEIVSFIENERRCCNHLAFSIDVPAFRAPLTLRVTGPGAAEELQALIR